MVRDGFKSTGAKSTEKNSRLGSTALGPIRGLRIFANVISIRRVRRWGLTESGFHNDLRKDIKGIWSCKTTVRSWGLGQSFIAFSASCRVSLVVGAGADLCLELRPSMERLNSGELYLRRFKCDSKRFLLVNRGLENARCSRPRLDPWQEEMLVEWGVVSRALRYSKTFNLVI